MSQPSLNRLSGLLESSVETNQNGFSTKSDQNPVLHSNTRDCVIARSSPANVSSVPQNTVQCIENENYLEDGKQNVSERSYFINAAPPIPRAKPQQDPKGKPPKNGTKRDRKVLHPQAKEVILNVVNFMKKEASGQFAIPPRKVQCRAALATGYSERTVRRVVKESRTLNGDASDMESAAPMVLFPPKKIPNRPKPKTGLDALTRCEVRKLIHKIYVNEKTVPTINKIHQRLVEQIGFKGGSRSAHKIVKELGFFWKKTNAKSFVLMEKHDIRLRRIEFLRDVMRFRHEARPFVYVADAVVHGTTGRVSALMAGTEKGLIQESVYICEGMIDLTSHLDRWTREALLPYLQPRSVVVLEHSSCSHERIPTLESDAETMKKWLTSKGIAFKADMLRPELHQVIRKSAGRLRKNKSSMEVILTDAGHNVLKTPLDHPDLNSATKIWADVQSSIPKGEENFVNQVASALAGIKPATWESRCNSVRACEQQYLACEGIMDAQVEKVLTAGKDIATPSDELDDNINFVRHFMGGLLGIEEHKLYN